jgi:hypothetical protein
LHRMRCLRFGPVELPNLVDVVEKVAVVEVVKWPAAGSVDGRLS